MKIAVGFLLAFGIGVACRVAGVPLPAPHALIGALLVVAMSLGYVVTDRFALERAAKHPEPSAPPAGGPEMREGGVP